MLRNLTLILFVLGFTALLSGCGSETGPDSGSQQAGSQSNDEINKALGQLPPADLEAARSQKTCPVSEKPLGSMGVPPKVRLGDHDVFICCAGCEGALKEEPGKYLSRLGHRDHQGAADHGKIAAALAKLSPEDQKAAHGQKICPVTGKPLGAMGVPKKVSVKGHYIFVCCPGCVDKVKENPELYLKKLGGEHQMP